MRDRCSQLTITINRETNGNESLFEQILGLYSFFFSVVMSVPELCYLSLIFPPSRNYITNHYVDQQLVVRKMGIVTIVYLMSYVIDEIETVQVFDVR